MVDAHQTVTKKKQQQKKKVNQTHGIEEGNFSLLESAAECE